MEFYKNYLTSDNKLSKVYWSEHGNPPYKKIVKGSSVEYKLNSSGIRCDDFIYKHNKEHILFAGCSISAGIGIDLKDTWCYKVHQNFKETSGYFNISLPGGSISEIVFNVFKYISKYGNPNFIFILLPNIARDLRYIKENFINQFVYNEYLSLNLYCKSNNIKLITSSWSPKELSDVLKDFSTFFEADTSSMYQYEGTIIAEDKKHPGTAIHSFWHNEFKDRIVYENFGN